MSNRASLAKPHGFEQIPEEFLIYSDGVPMDDNWQRMAMNLLIDSVSYHFRDREDFFTGGNMFVYFSEEHARNKDFRGPDFFFVWNTTRLPNRRFWYVWEEQGRTPNVVVEFISPSTRKEDYGVKKDIYEQVLQVGNYYCYDLDNNVFDGWRLHGREYASLSPNEKGWLWCEELQLWLGSWRGKYKHYEDTYLRFYDRDGKLVLTDDEAAELASNEQRMRADEESRRADEESRRADEESRRADEERRRADEESRRADEESRRAGEERRRADEESRRAGEERRRAIDESRRADKAEADNALLLERLARLEKAAEGLGSGGDGEE